MSGGECLVAAATVLAHVNGLAGADGPKSWNELARAWEWEPLVVVPLALAAWLYRRGTYEMRRRFRNARGLRGWEVGSYWAGWWLLLLALVSPLHPWGRVLFSAHMTQHEVLMVGAAPLLVLGRPGVVILFAFPGREARELARLLRSGPLRSFWRIVANPVTAWGVHAVALWVWHVPAFFQATLRVEWVHHAQHASFFGSAVIFWWALVHGRAGPRGFGVAVLYLFTTMAHSGLLGALIAFSDEVLYPIYAPSAAAWSLSAGEDQQIGGLIMWVPAALVYMVAALAMIAGWLRQAERRYPARGDAADAIAH